MNQTIKWIKSVQAPDHEGRDVLFIASLLYAYETDPLSSKRLDSSNSYE